jgi:hypothetical protein
MRAVVFKATRDVAVDDVDDARIEPGDDAVVRITSSALCGTDLHMYEGRTGAASEDFSDIPAALGVPYTYWGVGCIDVGTYRKAEAAGRVAQDIPVNHSPNFAPSSSPPWIPVPRRWSSPPSTGSGPSNRRWPSRGGVAAVSCFARAVRGRSAGNGHRASGCRNRRRRPRGPQEGRRCR